MNLFIRLILLISVMYSCSTIQEKNELVTKKLSPEEVKFTGDFYTKIDSLGSLENTSSFEVGKPVEIFQTFNSKITSGNLEDGRKKWDELKTIVDFKTMDYKLLKNWFDYTGSLFEATGEIKYSNELENIYYFGFINCLNDFRNEVEKTIIPYIFTRNIDCIHVNLFLNSELRFTHSFGGDIVINMETNYPESGKVLLKFNLHKKRFAEINIRIPDSAEGASVEVKGVKFLAVPGSYCKISKNWKDNDVIVINFPKTFTTHINL